MAQKWPGVLMVSRTGGVLSDSKLYIGWRVHVYPCRGTAMGAPHGGVAGQGPQPGPVPPAPGQPRHWARPWGWAEAGPGVWAGGLAVPLQGL